VSYEDHKNIIEMQSLGRALKIHLDRIEENKKRLDFIKLQRTLRERELIAKQEELKASEEEFKKLEKEARDESEDRRLELLMSIDECTTSIKDAESFIAGSANTLKEIQSDVYSEDGYEMRDMEHIEMRIKALIEALSPSARDTFDYVIKFHKIWNFVQYIEGNRCSKCRFVVETSTIQKIENGYSVEACSGCNSILISTHART